MDVFEYTLAYDDERGVSVVHIPQLEGESLQGRPSSFYWDDTYLKLEKYEYSIRFNPYNSEVFTEIHIQKEGGNSMSARASSYYTNVTKQEAEYMLEDLSKTTLGIESFELKRKRLKKSQNN